jgi:D-lyxose ketol-isomerase
MKRSQINQLLRAAQDFFRAQKYYLPPFGYWGPADWRAAGAAPLAQAQLGWDITDFGSGDFYRQGLVLFTLRNGLVGDRSLWAKDYAEKIMVVREGQVTPTHFHHYKMEDIINRGGGTLAVQLWQSDAQAGCSPAPVRVYTDGQERELPAGGIVELLPGESVTLPPRLYHQFWGKPGHGQVLVGEVSRVNDDRTDNHFYQPVGRFPSVEEDESPLHLLVSDYANWLGR